jgi:serine/threonine protein kinase
VSERALVGGRYELGPAIGSGGFATVYRARDRQTEADVAVKLVLSGLGSELLAARLKGEAEALKRLSSRFIARIHDAGEDESGVWLVTELVDGVHLEPAALGRPLQPHEVLRVARGLLEGLADAHGAGIVHGDVKPSNILVPMTKEALDAPKLIDFGLARTTARADLLPEVGEAAPASGVVLGSARYMAPEVLRGATPDVRSDVYAAGLVLFELLADGALFPGEASPIRARLALEPDLEGRVPPPLSSVLARMLARDPAHRYRDAREAHGAIVDLDTAPVSVVGDETPAQSVRVSLVPPRTSVLPPMHRASTIPPMHRASTLPPVHRESTLPPPPAPRNSSMRPPAAKLTTLPADGALGLRETLRHLDVAMLDALARRERGNAIGRVARACALSLRLELDAAALILEPLAAQSDVARAVGATLLAPRARRVTRARVDADREDLWLGTVPAELGALFAALGSALGTKDDAARDASRCAHALERLGGDRADALVVTVRIAHTAARVRLGEIDPGAALDLVRPLDAGDARTPPPFDRVVRALLLSAICVRLDEARARDELERAVRLAAESGTTLLEACAASAWGRLLVENPARVDRGLAVLERASTLLAHGDAPTLEHEAEHHRAAALLVQGRWDEAVPVLQRARAAAHAERAVQLEVLSASLEVVAHLAKGDAAASGEAIATLGDARIGTAGGRAAGLAWLARSLDAMASGDREGAETALAEARARVREAGGESADAYVLVEVLGLLFDAARGDTVDVATAASDLERFAGEHGFASHYWFEVLRAVVERTTEPAGREAMLDVLSRVTLLLGPTSRLSRERRTSAPPPP